MNSWPRWLISITDMPEPCQSSISEAACSRTSSGRTAGPALKLKTRLLRRVLAVFFFIFLLGDALDPGELRALVEIDQAHALRGSSLLADLLDARADRDAGVGDQHHLVLVADEHRADELAVPLGRLDADHPLRASSVARVLRDRGALAEAVLGRGEDGQVLVVGDQHRDDFLALAELHAAHAVRLPAHGPHVVLLETHRLAR